MVVVLVGRVVPTHGKLLGLIATAGLAVIYFGLLIVTGEFGPDDRAKFARILRRR